MHVGAGFGALVGFEMEAGWVHKRVAISHTLRAAMKKYDASAAVY